MKEETKTKLKDAYFAFTVTLAVTLGITMMAALVTAVSTVVTGG